MLYKCVWCVQISCFKIRMRKPKALLKFVPCGKCVSTR